jgi:hypothetical protein
LPRQAWDKRTQRGKVATPHQLQDRRSSAARQQRGPAARLKHTISFFEKVLPTCVPSLSWQNDEFQYTQTGKPPLFFSLRYASMPSHVPRRRAFESHPAPPRCIWCLRFVLESVCEAGSWLISSRILDEVFLDKTKDIPCIVFSAMLPPCQ